MAHQLTDPTGRHKMDTFFQRMWTCLCLGGCSGIANRPRDRWGTTTGVRVRVRVRVSVGIRGTVRVRVRVRVREAISLPLREKTGLFLVLLQTLLD